MVEIANVVGTGSLGIELDIDAVQVDLDVPFTEYNPKNYHGLYVRLEEGGPLITVYRSGKYNISGSASVEELEETNKEFLIVLGSLGITIPSSDTGFAVQNVVMIGGLHHEVDLNTLAIGFGLEVTEYEPEQFPGLVYRPQDLPVVFLIFSSGKIVITGTSDTSLAEKSFKRLKSRISEVLTT